MLTIAHDSHPGETGKNNEDRCAVSQFESAAGPATLALVADGIGGHRAGEVASQLAVEVITAEVRARLAAGPRPALEQAFAAAAQRIAAEAESKPDLGGMGTTCVSALVLGGRLHIAYIGDSRIYLQRGGALRQISVDHTFVQEAVEHGVLTADEARTSPQRHVLRRHIGKDPEVKPDFRLRLHEGEAPEQSEQNQGLALAAGDTLLLCSDGLSDLVEAAELEAALRAHEPAAAVETLIALARQRGGYDNITLIVLKEL